MLLFIRRLILSADAPQHSHLSAAAALCSLFFLPMHKWLRRFVSAWAAGGAVGGDDGSSWGALQDMWPPKQQDQESTNAVLHASAELADSADQMLSVLPTSSLPCEFAAMLWSQCAVRRFEAVRSAGQRTQLARSIANVIATAFFSSDGGGGGEKAAIVFILHAVSHFEALGSPERSQLKV